MQKVSRRIIASVIAMAVVVAGAVAAYQVTSREYRADRNKLSVTASFYPLYDFARQVGGDKVSVVNMTPAGAEPHDYEPSPRELIDAHESAVFIYNGGQMEPWTEGFLSDYAHVAVRASKNIELLEAGHGHDHDDENSNVNVRTDVKDPHFWLDPILAQQIVTNIRDGFIQADPENEEYYTENAARYNEALAELDKDFSEGLKSCKLDTVISSHEAFSYLAARYNFEVVSIAGIEPGIEPSVAKMANLTELVKQKNIKYIFFESLVSPRLAETIANETGASTLIFDPLEGLSQADQDKGRDYISVQRDNLKNLRTALECN